MTQDSDDLLALVFSAPIHLAPTQVKQDGDTVITSSEATHFESHHSSSGHHEEETHETHHIVEKHYSFSHSDSHVERSGTIESEHLHNDVHERKNTASTIRSAATSVSVHSGVSGHTHEQMSYDLPKLDDVVFSGEAYVHERHGTGSDHSESTVTVVSSHVHQPEEAHAPAVVGDIKNPIAPYRTPSHDAVIEQFKSLHKRESVASSVQHQGEDLTPVKVTHYQFDSNDTYMGDHSTHDDLDVLPYEELSYEPIPRMTGAEVAQIESHDHHHEESHHHEPRHHDSDDEHFTFEQVEYVQEKSDEPRYLRESEHVARKHEQEMDRRQSSHEQRTSTKLYDPYSLPAEMRTRGRQDDVSEELIEHVVGEIMRAVTQPGDSDHFYDSRSSLSSTIRSNKKQSGVHEKHDNTYHSVYDKEHRHHRESPLLADTHRRHDTGEQVEIRTQMHQSGHSTLVRQKERPTSDLPVNTGAVKQLRQKLEMGRTDFFEHKPHKEIDIFESLDDNANYKESVVTAPPAQEVRHQFHELRFRQPKDLAKTVVELHHEEHDNKQDDDTCSEDSSVYHDARRTHTRVDHSRDHHRRHHDEDHHHSNAKKPHTRVEHTHEHHHDDHHRHHRRSERHHDDHDRHHEDYDRHHQNRHHHERHEHHTEKTHAPVHRKHSEQSYESSEYLTQYSEDENQLTVSELTNVFGGAVKLRKPDHHEHQEEHKTHKRTTSIHHIEDVVRTTNVGGNVADPRSAAVAVHSYTPQTVQQTTGTTTASRHYTPTKAAPKVTPTSAPLAVARPTRANSEQFNSIRVVRNVRDFVSVYGRKDFQSGEQEAPVSPKGQVVPTVREEKIFSPVSVPPRPNVVHAHQEMHKKQQVIKTDGHQYTKVDAVVQQRAVAPTQVPVPAKREMHSVAAHAHPAPVEVPYYQPPHCCCCNHLMHLHHSQQHAYNLVHNPALMHNVAPMLQYHHAGEHHHEGFQYGGHHHELEHQHHFEDHRGRADSDESFVLVTVSERRAAFEQKTSDANGSFHEGPKPMVDIYSD